MLCTVLLFTFVKAHCCTERDAFGTKVFVLKSHLTAQSGNKIGHVNEPQLIHLDRFTPAEMDTGIFANLSYVVSNEGDWPDVGFATGFR
jgi:hypothetical protein